MDHSEQLLREHLTLSRRYFLKAGVGLGTAGLAGLNTLKLLASGTLSDEAFAKALSELSYLTNPEDFGTVERGDPLPYKHSKEKRLEIGLERDTWQLEVVADPESNSKLDNPLSKEFGTALTWDALMELAKTRAVRYMKIMTCLNVGEPLGMGLWEGVPLRDVIWLAKPVENVRRVYYYGYHNDDPNQLFQSSLPIGRVLEDPPGAMPVLLCYKLNGKWLSGKRGGPARIIVPDAYGFKSIKWLQRVVLTNRFNANDTYERGNNDIDSRMKSFARFIHYPKSIKAGEPIPLTGLAQVGMSGLRKVQIWLQPSRQKWPDDDPYFTKANWRDAELLPPPTDWGSDFGTQLPPIPAQFDANGKPRRWQIENTKTHWAMLLRDVPAGKYSLRCRTIDAKGYAQPMPRPFKKSGGNSIHRVRMTVKA